MHRTLRPECSELTQCGRCKRTILTPVPKGLKGVFFHPACIDWTTEFPEMITEAQANEMFPRLAESSL